MAAVESRAAANGQSDEPEAPQVGVDVRNLIPKLGLREYWYLLPIDLSGSVGEVAIERTFNQNRSSRLSDGGQSEIPTGNLNICQRLVRLALGLQ